MLLNNTGVSLRLNRFINDTDILTPRRLAKCLLKYKLRQSVKEPANTKTVSFGVFFSHTNKQNQIQPQNIYKYNKMQMRPYGRPIVVLDQTWLWIGRLGFGDNTVPSRDIHVKYSKSPYVASVPTHKCNVPNANSRELGNKLKKEQGSLSTCFFFHIKKSRLLNKGILQTQYFFFFFFSRLR